MLDCIFIYYIWTPNWHFLLDSYTLSEGSYAVLNGLILTCEISMVWRCHISTTEVSLCCKICQKLCHSKTQKNCTDTFYTVSAEHKMLHTTNKTVLFFYWHKSIYRYRVNLLYRTACCCLLFDLTQFIRCVLERSIQNVLMFSQS